MNPATLSRRDVLAGLGVAGAGTLAGCSDRAWSAAEHSPPSQVELTVKTPPTDDDVVATKIGSQLTENLQTAGIDALHQPIAERELHRDVLMNHEFDIFVVHHPGFDDVDALRGLLQSQYLSEQGWQNPFGFADGLVDELLETQCRQAGYERVATATNLFDHLLETAPYSAIVYPDRVGAARTDLNASQPPQTPLEYAALMQSADDTRQSQSQLLRVALFSDGITEQLNPITVGCSDERSIVDLLYDPLVRQTDDGYIPWLASTVEWDATDDPVTATVTLRDGTVWHDGTTVDAADIAFTKQFLEDTSLGAADSTIPAPRYRSRTTLIDDLTTVDERTVRIAFGDCTRAVAERALTLPLLPEHIWSPQAELVDDLLTEALVWDNAIPVGSGLFRFSDARAGDWLRLDPFRDHVLWRDEAEIAPLSLQSLQYGTIEFQVAANAEAAIDALLADELDLIAGSLSAANTDPIASAAAVDRLERSTRSFYLVGYNVRHPQLGNPRFRHAVSQLIDREYVADEFVTATATPAASHNTLAGIAPSAWEQPLTAGVTAFPGTDGEIDAEAVRPMFRDAGYRYDGTALLGSNRDFS